MARTKVGATLKRATAVLAMSSLLAGCVAGPNYAAPTPASLALPAQYTTPAARGAPIDLATWWQQFDDPLLTDLVARATSANLDIAASRSRLLQAREALVQARAALFPTVTGGPSASHTISYTRTGTIAGVVVPGSNSAANSLALALDAAWAPDIFGGTRRSIEAARASADSALFALVGVRTAVAGEVATNYIDARLAQAELAIARDTLRTQDDNLDIAGWRLKAGLVSSIDEEQARAQRAQTAATIPGLETSFTSAVNRLGVLTGQAPGALRSAITVPGTIPRGPAGVAVGIPADTLRQRPDVRGAERDLAAATARIGVAQAQLYPALSITGSFGASGSSLPGLTDLVTGTLFAGLTQTIFDGGRLHSQLRSARDAADGAFATYKSTVLIGLEDVENGLQALTSAQEQQAQDAIAADASNNAAIFARSQYRTGLIDFITLLQSEQTLLAARNALVSAQAGQATALVQLYLALGGGWQPDRVLVAQPAVNGPSG